MLLGPLPQTDAVAERQCDAVEDTWKKRAHRKVEKIRRRQTVNNIQSLRELIIYKAFVPLFSAQLNNLYYRGQLLNFEDQRYNEHFCVFLQLLRGNSEECVQHLFQ